MHSSSTLHNYYSLVTRWDLSVSVPFFNSAIDDGGVATMSQVRAEEDSGVDKDNALGALFN